MDDKIVFDFCSDFIVLVDYFGNVLKFNKKAESVFKVQEKKIKGSDFFAVMEKKNIKLCFSLQDLHLVERKKALYFKEDTLFSSPTKQKYIFHWTIKRFSIESQQKDIFVIIGKDISEIISYKISLEDSRIYLKSIIENLPQYVYWKDKNLVYQGCNNLVAQYLGLNSPLEIIGKTDNDFNWNQTRVNFLHKIDKTILEKGTTDVVEDAIPKEDGTSSIMLTSKAPLKNENNEIIGILGISFDITDRKNMEKELQQAKLTAESASRAKTEFIANMSHDIRTPLTGILGLAQEMVNTVDDVQSTLHNSSDTLTKVTLSALLNQTIENLQQDSQLLIGSTAELLELCNEILETMQLESGKLQDHIESFNLREMIEHNIELLKSVARHKKIKLSYEIESLLPIYYSGFRNYLDRTLLNLLSNALKFTNQGFVKINVQLLNQPNTEYKTGDKLDVKISVEDSGIGIPEDKFAIIFEHFSRLTPSYQGLYKGAGLGLYTVKRYIEAMKGNITLKSVVGKGSCFNLTIPLTVSDHSDREKISYRMPIKNKAPLTKPIATFKSNKTATNINATILIVEDNHVAAKAVQANLSRLDSSCISDIAVNGKQAIEMAQQHDYDLIIMDIGLPDIDGIEVTRQILASNHHKDTQPSIIALTGHASDHKMKAESLAAGMREVFAKPLPPTTLDSLLQRYVFKTVIEQTTPKESKTTVIDINKEVLQVIDWNESLQQIGGDEDCLHELLSTMLVDLKISKEILAQAYATHDFDLLRKELHRIRGGVVYLTLPQLSQALAEFHDAVKAKPQLPKQLEDTYHLLEKAIDEFCKAIEKNN